MKDIRTSLLSRGFSLAKASIKAGGLFAGRGSDNWLPRVELIIQELGQLKGTAMKVGQSLSMYGEHLLPKEVNDLLKTLQQNSPALAWGPIHQVLIEELGAEKLSELEIDEEALASASIGQVHRATIKATGEKLALKVQYPGVAAAVDTDMKLLKFILNMSDMVPRGPRFDQIFSEIRTMFDQEVNYNFEREFTEKFRAELAHDPRFIVPKVFPRYCTGRVLATEFVDGFKADSTEVQSLPLERRNQLGRAFLDLYLLEFFKLRLVQTDPHLGNYRVQLDEQGQDRLVLFDFGAVRDVPEPFWSNYRYLVRAGLNADPRDLEKGGRQLGLLTPDDPMELVRDYTDLCQLLLEPFAPNQIYDWGKSDLPRRVAVKVSGIAFNYKLRAPPREQVFLDRKLGGVFIFLSVLQCQMQTRPTVMQAVDLKPD